MVTEVVQATRSFSPTLYITLFILILTIAVIFFLVRKLNYNFNQFLISLKLPIIIVVVLEIIIYFIIKYGYYPLIHCDFGKCPTPNSLFLGFLPYTLIIVLLSTSIIYYLIKLLRTQKA